VRAPILTLKRARKLRQTMTLPEILLWEQLRCNRLHGAHFRRQHPMGPYVLDFYCCAAQLAVEVDGLVHEGVEQTQHDERRDRWLARKNIRILRFPARDVLSDEEFEAVLANIAQAASPSASLRLAPPPLRGRGALFS
jgi:very-short-patch-repair endonuclease